MHEMHEILHVAVAKQPRFPTAPSSDDIVACHLALNVWPIVFAGYGLCEGGWWNGKDHAYLGNVVSTRVNIEEEAGAD